MKGLKFMCLIMFLTFGVIFLLFIIKLMKPEPKDPGFRIFEDPEKIELIGAPNLQRKNNKKHFYN